MFAFVSSPPLLTDAEAGVGSPGTCPARASRLRSGSCQLGGGPAGERQPPPVLCELEPDELIRRVRSRLADPNRWHGDNATRRGDFGCGGALDAHGQQVEALDPAAVQWCVIGAFKLEAGVGSVWPLPGAAGDAFDRVSDAAGWERGACWNDRDGYDHVIDALDAALGQT